MTYTSMTMNSMAIRNGDQPQGSVAVVVAAAGRGHRLGGSRPKALECIGGETLLTHVLRTLTEVPGLRQVVVTAPADAQTDVQELCAAWPQLLITVIAGGLERQDSVRLALAELDPECATVLVHDAARALTPASLFTDVISAVQAGASAVVPGLPVADTIKSVTSAGTVTSTVDRGALRAIQTPQGFDRAALTAAHAAAVEMNTDDAGLIEQAGGDVIVIAGHPQAFKITTPFDVIIAEAVLATIQEKLRA